MVADQLGKVVDRLIGIFSPEGEMKRTAARLILRQYAAAKTTRLTGDWSPVSRNVNTTVSLSNATIKARVRQLVRDFPYFAHAVNVLVDFTVGQGLTFQSRMRDEHNKLNKLVCQKIEDSFAFWADEADIAGKLHYYELMRLAKRQEVEVGEFLIVKAQVPDRNRYLPYALQIYEADWLTTQNDTFFGTGIGLSKSSNGVEIWQGIEYKVQSGEILAYHFSDPEGWGRKTKRIPASDVIHGFDTLRPGQLRGVSPFAPAVLVAHDLGDYMDAEIDGAKMAAKWLAFVETGDLAGFQALRTTTNPDNDEQQLENIENAIIEYLRPGEKVNLASSNRPGNAFDPFTRLILRMVAITVGVSYELLSGDYQGLNYTVLRGVRNDLITQFRPIVKRHERQFCWKTFRPFLDWAVLTGKIKLPDYFDNPYPYLKAQWIPQGMPPVDPLKEGRAEADAISNLLRSPQEVAASRGRDYEEVLDEIQAARQMQAERDLEVISTSKSLKGNAASLDDQNDGEEDADRKTRQLVDNMGSALKTMAYGVNELHRNVDDLERRFSDRLEAAQSHMILVAARETPAPNISITVPERQMDVVVNLPRNGPVEKIVTERTAEGFAKRIIEREISEDGPPDAA